MGIFLLFYSNYIDVIGRGTATNDVDIISSRNGQRVALAVFIADSKAPLSEREKVMSDIVLAVVKAIQ